MDQIINYLLLTIIFVFDPLAIALVIAANYAFEKLRPKTKKNLYGEKVIIEDKDPIENLQDEDEWEAAERRMNIIGQNGNDGDHYYDEPLSKENLEEQLSSTSKNRKYGSKGWKTLEKKLQNLKKKDDRNDDLTIKY